MAQRDEQSDIPLKKGNGTVRACKGSADERLAWCLARRGRCSVVRPAMQAPHTAPRRPLMPAWFDGPGSGIMAG